MAYIFPLDESECSKRSKRIRKKINIEDEEAAPPSETPASKFMSIVSDDLLIQIILHLPHDRDAIRCTTVGKRWYPLIDHHFGRSFLEYHDSGSSSYFLPYTLLFINSASNRILDSFSHPAYQILSKKSNILHGIGKPTSSSSTNNYLNFLWRDLNQAVKIKASVNDLLLVSTPDAKYYICNLLTKQRLALPQVPSTLLAGRWGLLYMSCEKQVLDIRFKQQFV